jgi:5-methylcytosine-specific restriction endonuclease McrA
MNIAPSAVASLTDVELLSAVARLAHSERHATVQLIAALVEIDRRQLYLGEGCSSFFAYCTRVLHLSEHAAYGRIEAVRAARRFPIVLDLLERGDLTLTSLCLLAPVVTETNHRDVYARARHRTKREVEEIAASLRPKPDVRALIRKLPEPPTTRPTAHVEPASATVAAPIVAIRESPKAAVVQALAPARYKLQVTVTRETRDKLQRVQDLMRHSVPNGDVAVVLDRALDLLLAHLERQKCAAAVRPRVSATANSTSRHIPAAVRRSVWTRDKGRCAFTGTRGRCNETGFLEFHHVRPFAEGGEATADNIELRCRAHNQYEADLFFGDRFTVREEPWRFGDELGLGPSWSFSTRRTSGSSRAGCQSSASVSPSAPSWAQDACEC